MFYLIDLLNAEVREFPSQEALLEYATSPSNEVDINSEDVWALSGDKLNIKTRIEIKE